MILTDIAVRFRVPLLPEPELLPASRHEEGELDVELEEGGVLIDNLELLVPTSPTSSGLSDEVNAVVLGQIVGFKENHLEEFEDISIKLIKLKEVEKMLKDPSYFFAMNVRLIIKYLLLRFKEK